MTYSQHISRWSAPAITVEWADYRKSCKSLIAAMRKHLDMVSTWRSPELA